VKPNFVSMLLSFTLFYPTYSRFTLKTDIRDAMSYTTLNEGAKSASLSVLLCQTIMHILI